MTGQPRMRSVDLSARLTSALLDLQVACEAEPAWCSGTHTLAGAPAARNRAARDAGRRGASARRGRQTGIVTVRDAAGDVRERPTCSD